MFWNVVSTFSSFYYKPYARAFPAWDPEFHRRTGKDLERTEGSVVDLTQAVESQEFQLPKGIQDELDRLITADIYKKIIEKKIDDLRKEGFVFLKSKKRLIFYHEQLPGYLVKIDLDESRSLCLEGPVKAAKCPQEAWFPLRHTNLLRPIGAQYFRQEIKKMPSDQQNQLEIPAEFYYRCSHAAPGEPLQNCYFAICENKPVFSAEDTVAALRAASDEVQRTVARLFIEFIKATRYQDLHSDNILKWGSGFKFVCVDTEPIGVKIVSEDREGAFLFQSEEHVVLGLINFMTHYCIKNGLVAMAQEVNDAIVTYVGEHRSSLYYEIPLPITTCQRWELGAKITVSILCPLIPIILLICSIVIAYFPPPNPLHPWYRYEKVLGLPNRPLA